MSDRSRLLGVLLLASACQTVKPPQVRSMPLVDPRALVATRPEDAPLPTASHFQVGLLYTSTAFGDAPGTAGLCDAEPRLLFGVDHEPRQQPLFMVRTEGELHTSESPTALVPGAANPLGLTGPLHVVEIHQDSGQRCG